MRQKPICRPDRDAMLRLLEEQYGTMTEIILRLGSRPEPGRADPPAVGGRGF